MINQFLGISGLNLLIFDHFGGFFTNFESPLHSYINFGTNLTKCPKRGLPEKRNPNGSYWNKFYHFIA